MTRNYGDTYIKFRQIPGTLYLIVRRFDAQFHVSVSQFSLRLSFPLRSLRQAQDRLCVNQPAQRVGSGCPSTTSRFPSP